MDIGQPKDFVTGVGMYLSYLADNHPAKLSKGDNFVGNVLVVRVLFSCVLYMYILRIVCRLSYRCMMLFASVTLYTWVSVSVAYL